MTNDELNDIFDKLIQDEQPVDNWTATSGPELETVRRHEPDKFWTRKKPSDPWKPNDA